MWAWRKYGQKPIKGSPYPRYIIFLINYLFIYFFCLFLGKIYLLLRRSGDHRNYYRCSSSKGCGARKQVERSYADPDSFIITYTGDHSHPRPTHRNSLAGSSRSRSSSSVSARNPASGGPVRLPSAASTPGSCASPVASPATPLNEEDIAGGEKEGEMFEDMAVDSDSDDDDDDVLIPNLTVRDEIFVGFPELGYSPRRRAS